MATRLTTLIVVAIVAATLIAGLIVGAQRDDNSGPVDLIIFNGKVYPADGGKTFAEAIAVRGNRILRVGSNREIKRLRRAQTTVIDAHGGAVVPGFNDAHTHLLGGGLALEHVNLLDAVTQTDIENAIKAYAAAHPDRTWVTGRGWYYQPFPGGLPTRQILDALVADRPAYMTAYDGHTAWVNTQALTLAGVNRRTPNPKNGVIVKDPRTGEPTGVLKEAAMRLVSRHLPAPTRDDQLRALRAAIREAHRVGVTSVQNASGSADEFDLYDTLRRDGDLQLRVYSALSIAPTITEADADALDPARARYPDDPLFKAGAVKIMGDGVVESYTAAMLEPYTTRPKESGTPNATDEELDRVVTMMDRRGWQIMIHAIGDRAIRQALDAYERAAAANPRPERPRRHRIEHIETIDPADVPRFGALGVIASLQPFHANPAPNQIGVWEANIGAERASRGWSYHSIAGAGGRLAFGSDWPVVTLDPRLGLNMAVNRTTPEGEPAEGWYPAEKDRPHPRHRRLYVRRRLRLVHDERRKGQIAPEMLADLVILSADIFAKPPSRLLDAVVTMTIFDGKVVYQRDENDTTN